MEIRTRFIRRRAIQEDRSSNMLKVAASGHEDRIVRTKMFGIVRALSRQEVHSMGEKHHLTTSLRVTTSITDNSAT